MPLNAFLASRRSGKTGCFPNPASDILAIHTGGLNNRDLEVELHDLQGKIIQRIQINKGQTIGYLDIQTVFSGVYFITFSSNGKNLSKKIIIEK